MCRMGHDLWPRTNIDGQSRRWRVGHSSNRSRSRERKAAPPSRCHLLGDRYRLRCTAARHVPRTVGFSVFLVHCARGNVAGVTETVGHTLGAKDEGYCPVEHEDTRIKIMRVRLAM